MRCYIGEDEWYPVYTLDLASDQDSSWRSYPIVEIPDELFAEYERIMGEFDANQLKLAAFLEERRTIQDDERKQREAYGLMIKQAWEA